jgi:hypothetical protein
MTQTNADLEANPTTPLRRRLQNWLVDNPGWENWVDAQDDLWLRLDELREQGHIAAEAYEAMGFRRQEDVAEIHQLGQEIDELGRELKREHDANVQLMADNRRWQHRFDNLTWNDLPVETRDRLLRQLAAQRSRRRGR